MNETIFPKGNNKEPKRDMRGERRKKERRELI